jgi:hypothetical protein
LALAVCASLSAGAVVGTVATTHVTHGVVSTATASRRSKGRSGDGAGTDLACRVVRAVTPTYMTSAIVRTIAAADVTGSVI